MRTTSLTICLSLVLTTFAVAAQVDADPIPVTVTSTPVIDDSKTVCNVEDPTSVIPTFPGLGGCAQGTLGTSPPNCLFRGGLWDCTFTITATLKVSPPACGTFSSITWDYWGEIGTPPLGKCVLEDKLFDNSDPIQTTIKFGTGAVGWFKVTGKVCVTDYAKVLVPRCKTVTHYFYLPSPPQANSLEVASVQDFAEGTLDAIGNKLSDLPVDPMMPPNGMCDETLVSDENVFTIYRVECPT